MATSVAKPGPMKGQKMHTTPSTRHLRADQADEEPDLVPSVTGAAIEAYLDSFDPPLDEDSRRHVGSAMMYRLLSQPEAAAPMAIQFLMMARKPSRMADPHPFSVSLWPGWEQVMAVGDVNEVESFARNPHPGARRLAALHPGLWDDLKDELATDLWREVRLSLARNPTASRDLLEKLAGDTVVSVASVAQRRLTENGLTEDFLDSLDVCVECAEPIKNSQFTTCSVLCSLGQANRRSPSGVWADAVEVDFRHSNNLRKDWPPDFIWQIAGTYAAGGIPGTGPRYRSKLVSFVRDLTAGQILDLCAEVREAGKDQAAAILRLEVLGQRMPGATAIELVRDQLGVGLNGTPKGTDD